MPSFPPTVSQINPLADVLTKRGITAEEAVKMEMALHSAEGINELTGFRIPTWLKGTFLPYHDLDGSILLTADGRPFCRWRMEMVNGRPLPEGTKRYTQPAKSGVAVYLPTNSVINWVDVAHDPSIEIWITEGEFKSVRLVQEGVVCIGLGGVDNWRNKDGILARPLDQFVWDKRKVTFCYDADPESTKEHPLKPTVEGALQRAAARLGELGAETFRVNVAQTQTFEVARAKVAETKMGVDDYLQAGGSLEDLKTTIERLDFNQEQARLLRTYAIYEGHKMHIVRISDGLTVSVQEFGLMLEAPAITIRTDPTNPKKKIRVREHEAWRENKSHLVIERYIFDPSGRSGYDPDDRTYNLWGGFAVEGRMVDADSYNETVRVWKKFIGRLFGEYADYFEKWLAHIFQKPGEKTSIAILLSTPVTGIGKTVLGQLIQSLIGEEGSLAIELDRMKSNFNAAIAKKLFIQMDETEGVFSGMESKLDDMITSNTTVIEKKGYDAYPINNFVRLFLTSNSSRPLRMKEENRRWLVISPDITVAESKGPWAEWMNRAVPQLRRPEGLRELRWYLDRVDLSGWVPTARVPVTQAMLDMIGSSQTKSGGVMEGLWEALQEDEEGFWAVPPDLNRQDSKVWSDLKAKVKANGGQNTGHQIRVKAKGKDVRIKFVLIDRDGRLPRKLVDGKWVLDNYGSDGERFVLTNEQVQSSAVRAQNAYTTHAEGVNRGGYNDKY